jgi:hypothetical protein
MLRQFADGEKREVAGNGRIKKIIKYGKVH